MLLQLHSSFPVTMQNAQTLFIYGLAAEIL